jgi:hypothetical protein
LGPSFSNCLALLALDTDTPVSWPNVSVIFMVSVQVCLLCHPTFLQ